MADEEVHRTPSGKKLVVTQRTIEITLADLHLQPGNPIPPELTGGMEGFVVGNCGHRVAGSEWRAGFRNCERCGE